LKCASIGIAAAFAAAASSAFACTIVWDEAYALRVSDAVVWGTYEPGDVAGFGVIKVSHRVKGPNVKEIPVAWDTKWVNDGASCPVWQPKPNIPRGRFFLRKRGDGYFVVDEQAPAKEAK
jgi:hypothetical protein